MYNIHPVTTFQYNFRDQRKAFVSLHRAFNVCECCYFHMCKGLLLPIFLQEFQVRWMSKVKLFFKLFIYYQATFFQKGTVNAAPSHLSLSLYLPVFVLCLVLFSFYYPLCMYRDSEVKIVRSNCSYCLGKKFNPTAASVAVYVCVCMCFVCLRLVREKKEAKQKKVFHLKTETFLFLLLFFFVCDENFWTNFTKEQFLLKLSSSEQKRPFCHSAWKYF